jgi:hypothetical protein
MIKALQTGGAPHMVSPEAASLLRDRLLDKSILRRAKLIARNSGRTKVTARDMQMAMVHLAKSPKTGKIRGAGPLIRHAYKPLKRIPRAVFKNYF